MSSLEQVVRPFQQPQVFNTTKIVPSVPTTSTAPKLKWGDVGTLPSPVAAGANLNISQENYTETARTNELDTVVGSDGVSSVAVNRVTKMTLDKSASQNVLPSALITDVDTAFNAFSTEIKNAFQPFDPDASSSSSKVTFNFHPGS